MLLEDANLELEGNIMTEQKDLNKWHRREKKKHWLNTFTKRAVTAILFFSLIDLQLTYVLAFMGKEQIAETLSSAIVTTIIPVMLGYFLKSLFETFFEKREERLRNEQAENYDEEVL